MVAREMRHVEGLCKGHAYMLAHDDDMDLLVH